jgi:hypothetical protein
MIEVSESIVSKQEIRQFTPLVDKIITSDKNCQRYILTCVRDSFDTNLLFFNIGRNYRFCPRKGSHHQHSLDWNKLH